MAVAWRGIVALVSLTFPSWMKNFLKFPSLRSSGSRGPKRGEFQEVFHPTWKSEGYQSHYSSPRDRHVRDIAPPGDPDPRAAGGYRDGGLRVEHEDRHGEGGVPVLFWTDPAAVPDRLPGDVSAQRGAAAECDNS